MFRLFHGDSWTLILAAVILAAALSKDQDADDIGRMAAFFTVLGDMLALLALNPGLAEQVCRLTSGETS